MIGALDGAFSPVSLFTALLLLVLAVVIRSSFWWRSYRSRSRRRSAAAPAIFHATYMLMVSETDDHDRLLRRARPREHASFPTPRRAGF